jgi:hypothetical protein
MSSMQFAETMDVECTESVEQLSSHAEASTLSPEFKGSLAELDIVSVLQSESGVPEHVAESAQQSMCEKELSQSEQREFDWGSEFMQGEDASPLKLFNLDIGYEEHAQGNESSSGTRSSSKMVLDFDAGHGVHSADIESLLALRDKLQAKVGATTMGYTSQDMSTAADSNESRTSFLTSAGSKCEACCVLAQTSATSDQLGDDICSCGDLFFRATHHQAQANSSWNPECIERVETWRTDVARFLNYDRCCCARVCAEPDTASLCPCDDICSCGDLFLRAHHQMDSRPLWNQMSGLETRESSAAKWQTSNENDDDVLNLLNYQLF